MKRSTLTKQNALEEWEDNLTNLYGPLPLNVFRTLRESEDLSHEALARLIHVDRHTLLRLEQGVLASPTQAVVSFWRDRNHLSELFLTDQYEEFQELTRRHYWQLFGPELLLVDDSDLHPLTRLRKPNEFHPEFSVMQVSKYLCVPQFNLQYWSNKWRVQKSVPKSFALALSSAGYLSSHINAFIEHYERWRETNR